MEMIDNIEDDTQHADDEDGDVSGRASNRRASRESKRAVSRSTSLRRRSPDSTPEQPVASTDMEEQAPSGKPARRTRREEPPAEESARPSSSRRRGERGDVRKIRTTKKAAPASDVSPSREPEPARDTTPQPRRPSHVRQQPPPRPAVAKRIEPPLEKPKSRQIKSRRREDEFELLPLPDGTMRRVKTADKNFSSKTPIARRRQDSYGPGPAVGDLTNIAGGIWNRDERTTAPATPVITETVSGSVKEAVAFLRRQLRVLPKVAVVLGSGLSRVSDLVSEDAVDFTDIPGFKAPKVLGHPGCLRAGVVSGTPTLFCEGRLHFYETGSMQDVIHPIETFIELGVEKIILATSAGALNPTYEQGDIMFVEDHINLMGENPFFGMDPSSRPSIFVDPSATYDRHVLDNSDRLGRRARVRTHVGVLAATRGPVYETPAERRFLKTIGADAVCMSIVPETLVAARAGIPVTALAVIVNDASGSEDEPMLSHEAVAREGKRHANGLKRLIMGLLEKE